MPAHEGRVVVRCDGVGYRYRTAATTVEALRGVDADFAAGAVSAVAGPSGSGKSSLLRILGGLARPASGSARVAGVDVGRASRRTIRRLRRRRVGYVFQRPSDNLLPYLTAWEQVALAARLRGTGRDDIGRLFELLGLTGREDHTPAHLSGGEQQRLAFAAAMVGSPAVVLADEPTAQLDDDSSVRLAQGLQALAGLGTAVIVTSHDPALLAAADHVVRLSHGEVVSGRPW